VSQLNRTAAGLVGGLGGKTSKREFTDAVIRHLS
jgi:hypothetical protein